MMMWYDVNKMNIIIILQLKKVIPFYLIDFKGAFKWCIIHFNLKHIIICVIVFFLIENFISYTYWRIWSSHHVHTNVCKNGLIYINLYVRVEKGVWCQFKIHIFCFCYLHPHYRIPAQTCKQYLTKQKRGLLIWPCPFVFVETKFYRWEASLLLGHWC